MANFNEKGCLLYEFEHLILRNFPIPDDKYHALLLKLDIHLIANKASNGRLANFWLQFKIKLFCINICDFDVSVAAWDKSKKRTVFRI